MRTTVTTTAQKLARALACAATAWACLHGAAAQAAPIRYANIMWDRDLNSPGARTVTFRVETGWRASDFGAPVVGGTVNLGLNFDFGDGQSQAMMGTVQQVMAGADTVYTVSTFTHTYAAGVDFRYDAGFSGCCTLPELQNSNAGQSFDISAEVNVGSAAPMRGPQSTTLPLLNLALGSGNQFANLPATAFGNEVLRYVLDPLGGLAQADIFTLGSFGGLQVNTSAAGLSSGLYDLRYRLESYNPTNGLVSSSTSVYMLVNLVCMTGPSCSNPGGEPPVGVPEPGSLPLVLLALLGLGGAAVARRRVGLSR